jgi:hypothetical protein
MTVQWLVTGASLLAALVAWGQARRTAQKLEKLSQMYWELKYQQGELRVQLQRALGDAPPAVPQPPAERPTDGFIPLSSLKR